MMRIDIEKDYYAILGVSASATQSEIKRAYHRLARRYHPDSRQVDAPTALFHQAQEAYAVLGDVGNRYAYDRQRKELGLGDDGALVWNVLLSQERLYAFYSEQMLYALIEIRPAATSENHRLRLNLCLVIDQSTSMKGARLQHVKEAARQIVGELHEDDALAMIAFSDRAEVLLPSQTAISRPQAKAKITALRAKGGTEILHGMRAGLAELEKNHDEHVISHLILLTDGCTYGDDETCIAEAERAGDRKIGITAMGIGEDWNDVLLDEIASRSGGTSAYIASPNQVQTLLQKRIRGLGATFATGLTLKARCADGVRVEGVFLTSPYLEPLTLSGGLMRLGSLEADVPMHVVLEMEVKQKSAGEQRLLQLELSGDVPSLSRREGVLRQDIRCVFTDDEPNLGKDVVPPAVVSALGRITLYRMQERAWSALSAGDSDRATSQLEMVATRLLEMGEKQLARAAMLEAGHVASKGHPTARGRKRIKYGTRSLANGGIYD
jgi:Ca-activated chloride channel family protein